MSTTNLVFIRDYSGDTTAPGVQIIWPPNGQAVVGNAFTLRGTVDDWTATVVAEIVNTNGVTNTVAGLVECNGMFWVEGLPLSGGSNWVTLTATDAAMNTTVTNLAVIQSGLVLTMNPVDGGALLKGRVTVTGTVGDAGYAVWVNGVPATVNPDGTWSAANVPVVGSGTTSFYINAYPPGEHPPVPDPPPEPPTGNPPSARAPGLVPDVEQRAHVRMRYYFELTSCVWSLGGWGCGMLWSPRGAHGFEGYTYGDWGHSLDYAWPAEEYVVWDAEANSTWGLNRLGTATYHWWSGQFSGEEQRTGVGAPRTTPSAPSYLYKPMVIAEDCYLRDLTDYDEYRRFAGAQLQFRTGGKALPRRRNLYQVLATASHITNPRWRLELPVPFDGVPAWRLQVGALGTPGNDSRLWRVLPDNAVYDVTVGVRGVCDTNHFYTYAVQPTKHRLCIQANGVILQQDRVVPQATNFWVGQRLTLDYLFFDELPTDYVVIPGDPPTVLEYPEQDAIWTLQGKCVNDPVLYGDAANTCTNYMFDNGLLHSLNTVAWWVNGGRKRVGCSVGLVFANGQRASTIASGLLVMNSPSLLGLDMCQDLDNTNVAYPDPCLYVTNHSGVASLGKRDTADDGGYARFWATYRARPGDWFYFTQLGRSLARTNGVVELDTGNEFWLDGQFLRFKGRGPVAEPDGIGRVQQTDAPFGALVIPDTVRTDQFMTYIQFIPEPHATSIPITLNRVDWSWGFTAQYVNGQWAIAPMGIVPPAWREDDSFPLWTGVLPGQAR